MQKKLTFLVITNKEGKTSFHPVFNKTHSLISNLVYYRGFDGELLEDPYTTHPIEIVFDTWNYSYLGQEDCNCTFISIDEKQKITGDSYSNARLRMLFLDKKTQFSAKYEMTVIHKKLKI
jgi:hypothetical protein